MKSYNCFITKNNGDEFISDGLVEVNICMYVCRKFNNRGI